MANTELLEVEARLGRPLEDDETPRVEALLDEAEVLVEAYLGRPIPEPAPKAVATVVSRMVARVLEAPEASFSVDTVSNTAGPFSQSRKFTTGASGGGPWLTANDKLILRRFRRGNGFYSIEVC